MAETKTETPPVIDTKALAAELNAGLGETIGAALAAQDARRDAQARQAAHQRQAAAQQRNAQPKDALAEVIEPYVAPRLQAAEARSAVASANALDYAQFYTDNPAARAHRGDIEAKFNELLAAGQPLKREDIFAWYRGGVKFDEFRQAANQEAEAAVKRAAEEGLVAGPSGAPVKVLNIDPYSMPLEELEKALENVVV